jgi:hypothetical protein
MPPGYSSLFPPHIRHNSLRIPVTLFTLRLNLNLTTNIPISENSKQHKRHRESPQREAQNHLILVRPVRRPNSIRNRTPNRLPRSENARRPRNIAIALSAFDLGHQPVHIRLQDLVEELEAEVDGECGVEEGAVAEVEGWWVGLTGKADLDDGVPGPGCCDCDEDEDVDCFRFYWSRE